MKVGLHLSGRGRAAGAMRLLAAALTLVALVANSPPAAGATCPLSDAEFSERVDALTTWPSIRDHQKQFFPPCADDGAQGQAHSELIVRTLVRRWGEISDLGLIAEQDPEFRRFVLRHVNAKSARADLQTLLTYTTIRCPSRQVKLCTEIRVAASKALEALR